jgi:hypothetical protein
MLSGNALLPAALVLVSVMPAPFILAQPAVAAPVPAAIRGEGGGNEMAPACAPAELKRLQADVTRLAGPRAPDKAWALAGNFLCGDTAAATRHVLDRMPKMLTSTSGGTDGESSALVPRDAGMMRRKQAWDGSAAAAGEDVRVLFWTDAACVGSADMRYRAGEWWLIAVSSACD